MKCVECQAEIEAESVYCPKCGARIDVMEGQEEEGNSDADVTQDPVSDEAEEEKQPEPVEQRTISERLLETARSGGQKTAGNDPGTAWTEGGYSPKALNGRFLNTIAVSVLLVAVAIWAHWARGWTWVWYPSLIVTGALWIWYVCVRVYRVWTIKYQLTAHQFYHEEGIFKRVRDVIEVIDIDDLKLERTLFDRMVNGGVGTVTIKSTDQSSPELRLAGLDDPDVVFKALDDARQRERASRGLKSV